MSAYPQLGIVEEVSTEADRPFHILARWPAVGRTAHPDWIRPAPCDVYRVPRVGGVVQIEPIAGNPGAYQWRGEDVPSQEDLPAEVLAAIGQVMVLIPASMRCYMVLDDREGSAGAIRLLTSGGGQVTIQNDGARVDVKAPSSGGIVRVEAASKVILEAPIVEVGEGAVEAIVKGTAFKALYNGHVHPTGVGPSGTPAVPMDLVPGTHLSLVGKVK